MSEISFICSCCKSRHDMEKKYPEGFSGWAYTVVEWSDFEENVPPLSETHWQHSDITPAAGTVRTVKVCSPFQEDIGSEFYACFYPALVYFNGYEKAKDFEDSAIVRCRAEKVIARDEFCAWIRVRVLEVIMLWQMAERYPAFSADKPLENFGGELEPSPADTCFRDDAWEWIFRDIEGDVCEGRIIYTDEKGVRHLVYKNYYDFFTDVSCFGNIVFTAQQDIREG